MSKYDDNLKSWNDECIETLSEAERKATLACEPDVEQFQRNTLDNIPQQFGDFLYTALGDRVTGQRSSVINKSLFEDGAEGYGDFEQAKNAGKDIETFLREEQKTEMLKPSYMRRWNRSQLQLYITAGRKFGVSYLTGEGNRVHTIYFGAGSCFQYLTQEHVDCVKNKLKRECTQDFLNFRNDFVKGVAELNNKIIETPVDVKLGLVSCVTKSPKVNSMADSYNDLTKKTFVILDNVVTDKITHTIATIHDIQVWDKRTNINNHEGKIVDVNCPSYVSFMFFSIDDASKKLSLIGNVDIGIKDMVHSLQNITTFNNRQVEHHIESYAMQYNITNNPAFNNTKCSKYGVVDAQGVLLNMDEVLQAPCIREQIDKRIKFYNEMSVRLQELKHKHSTLYFINGDL